MLLTISISAQFKDYSTSSTNFLFVTDTTKATWDTVSIGFRSMQIFIDGDATSGDTLFYKFDTGSTGAFILGDATVDLIQSRKYIYIKGSASGKAYKLRIQ